jgi:plasmid stabilization system protein ParE
VIRFILATEAEADALDAFAFYESRQDGLGQRFRDHLGVAIARIQAAPERYPVVYKDLRRRLVERFPYAVFYRMYPGVVVVVSVMHVKMSPRRLIGRSKRQSP